MSDNKMTYEDAARICADFGISVPLKNLKDAETTSVDDEKRLGALPSAIRSFRELADALETGLSERDGKLCSKCDFEGSYFYRVDGKWVCDRCFQEYIRHDAEQKYIQKLIEKEVERTPAGTLWVYEEDELGILQKSS